MKIAFTSSDGNRVDRHFGEAEAFYVWDIGPQLATCLGRLPVPERDGQEDRILARADLLADCTVVCTVQIGGPAAAKLVARHIHPLKTTQDTPVSEMITSLQTVLRGKTPPWLRKAMAAAPTNPAA
jgi:nitrogen fixation protein NifX